MDGIQCLWTPWKKGDILPNLHYVLFPLFKKWRRREWIRMMKMASGKGSFIFIPILTHVRSWRRAPFSTRLCRLSRIRSMFLIFHWSQISTSLISSMVEKIPWSGIEKTHNKCILLGFPTFSWNGSDFHIVLTCYFLPPLLRALFFSLLSKICCSSLTILTIHFGFPILNIRYPINVPNITPHP